MTTPGRESPAHIEAIEPTPAGIRRFLRVPYRIYPRDSHWVAPVEMDLAKVFGPANPLFQHAHLKLWVARRGGRDVGRIAGIVDHHHIQYQKDQAAFFGFFECANDPELARELLRHVETWAATQQLERVIGPMNPTTNDECGLFVEGDDGPPVLMMTYNPRYYPALLESAGYQKEKDLLAYHIDLAKTPMDRFTRLSDRVRRRHPELTFRPVRFRTLRADLDRIKDVYNSAWERNWGFVPMTEPEIDFLASRLKPLLTEGLVWLAEAGTRPVGFLLAMVDFNVALKPLRGRLFTPGLLRSLPYFLRWKTPKRCRVITLGVCEEYRGQGLESVLLYEGLRVGERLGLTEAEASWILEDNQAMRRLLEVFGARPYRTYRIYARGLAAPR